MNTGALIYFMIVTFTANNTEAVYQMQSLAQCESARRPVIQLYENLNTPVTVVCKAKVRKGTK